MLRRLLSFSSARASSSASARALSVLAPAAAPSTASTAPSSLPPLSAAPSAGTASSAAGLRFEVGRLEAVRRDTVGKRNAAWTRMNGLIPGLIYGVGRPLRVYVKESDLRAEVNKRRESFLNTLFDVVVDGVAHRVLARDFQMHPFKPKFISCNWLRYKPGRSPGVRVDLPLRTLNEERCTAFKDGGWLLELIHKLPVYAHGDEIPDAVYLDLRGRRLGEKIMASEIEMGDGLSLLIRDQDYAVAKFVGAKRVVTEGAVKEAAKPKKAAEKAAEGAATPKK